jgi:hypothetical protein
LQYAWYRVARFESSNFSIGRHKAVQMSRRHFSLHDVPV